MKYKILTKDVGNNYIYSKQQTYVSVRTYINKGFLVTKAYSTIYLYMYLAKGYTQYTQE